MKAITEQHLSTVVSDIVNDKKKEAKVVGSTFMGVPKSVMYSELDKRLGIEWVAVEDNVVRITKDDVNAMANGRFFRKTGMRLLMILAIVVLGLATLNTTVRVLPNIAYYILEIGSVLGFMFVFSKKQRESRKELRMYFEQHGVNLGKE